MCLKLLPSSRLLYTSVTNFLLSPHPVLHPIKTKAEIQKKEHVPAFHVWVVKDKDIKDISTLIGVCKKLQKLMTGIATFSLQSVWTYITYGWPDIVQGKHSWRAVLHIRFLHSLLQKKNKILQRMNECIRKRRTILKTSPQPFQKHFL